MSIEDKTRDLNRVSKALERVTEQVISEVINSVQIPI